MRRMWNVSHTDASSSRQELSNEYLVAKIGFDTAENEPLKVRITDHTFDHIPSTINSWFMVLKMISTVTIVKSYYVAMQQV